MSLEHGTVIAGKYRVERMLGQGGMGVVFAARHLGLDEMVAVKLIRGERAGQEILARFQREARAAARIKNEHVARVLDVDRTPEGAPYIVMELIDGTDLHALVKERGPLDPEEATAYIVQACEGLAEAHALGMVHRDLKLKNLFLTRRRDGRALIKVIDFGVVKFASVGDLDVTRPMRLDGDDSFPMTDAALTGDAVLVGSVHYMAPEQIRASNVVDARADVWSLGVCLFALLTGTLPFEGATIINVCAAIQGRAPKDLRELAPSVGPGLAAVVEKALEKDLRRRFASVGDLASALAPFGADAAAPARIATVLASTAPRAPVAEVAAEIVESTTVRNGRTESTITSAAADSLPSPRGRTWRVGAVGLVAIAVVTLGLRTLQRPTPRDRPPPLPASGVAASPPTAAEASGEPTTTTTTAASVSASAPATSAASPEPATRATSKRGPRPARTATPPGAPKPEPSNAYDRF